MGKITGILLLVLLVSGVAIGGAARAQYPEPIGSSTTAVSNSSPQTGGQVVLTTQVRDLSGDPVAGLACTFSVADQPGSDASLASTSGTTDAQGVATVMLNAGSTAGQVRVVANCGGQFSQVLVQVQGAAAPPQAPLQAPQTGDGGLL